ncbi:MAG: D-alanine--D-alanine ligase [Deltaproteobacteria bacterium]|nr:D-alanine--D-alanine ligase [Deltaproteobacteria bacterium]
MGGPSKEREVSLRSGRAVLAALQRRGYDAVEIDAAADLPDRLRREGIAAVFIALHGKLGEDGCVQGMLEWLGIPYTGAGVLGSSVGMDKVVCKRTAQSLGIPVAPDAIFIAGRDDPTTFGTTLPMSLPVIVKPSREGSTINVTIVQTTAELSAAIPHACESDGTVLVEKYVKGTELTVGLLEGKALPVVEIVPKSGFYDYTSKYTKGMTEYIVPARIDAETTKALRAWSEKLAEIVGAVGFARADYMMENHDVVFLELNTIPGMTDLSLVPMAARAAGIEFDELCERILEGASLKA